MRDVRAGLDWLFSRDGAGRGKYPAVTGEGVILVGHSVGATVACTIALGLDDEVEGGMIEGRCRVRALVGVEGVYDFVALRDAHWEYRGVYEEIARGAFGAEEDGGWERGDVVKGVREGRGWGGTEVVVLGHSKEDELVEWGQMRMIEEALRETGWRDGGGDGRGIGNAKEMTMMELKGGHDEVWEKGEELARCIALAVEKCVIRDSDRAS